MRPPSKLAKTERNAELYRAFRYGIAPGDIPTLAVLCEVTEVRVKQILRDQRRKHERRESRHISER